MLSILPKHVADEMLKDMKKDPSQKEMQQFNTMYMYRHENVRWGWLLPMPWSMGKISQFLVFRARKALKGDWGGGGVWLKQRVTGQLPARLWLGATF